MKFRIGAIAAALTAGLLLPAAAHAAQYDLAISETPSAHVVKLGSQVTFAVTVTNQGTKDNGDVFMEVSSLGGHGLGADDPYQSVSTSQGTCTDGSGPAFGSYYHETLCELGPLASGASAHITAVVKVNQSMNHFASLLPNAYSGGYQDDNNSNNEAIDRITASTPPTVSGSKKIKLTGLPAGCAPGDFTLNAVANVTGVKKMAASLFIGYDQQGFGQTWQKVTNGNHLRAKVPASRLAPDLGVFYKLKVKAKRGAAGPLKVTVTFQPC